MTDRKWLSSLRHIFKIDPNRPLTDEQINSLSNSGTDAIVIGGTLGVTYDDTVNLLRKVRKNNITVILEISDLDAIVPGFDYYFIPLVLNAQDPEWLLNPHHYALKKYGNIINWEQVFIEGYVILNGESSAAKLTNSKTDLSIEDVAAYGRMCDQMLKLPILYIEYSGVFGIRELVKEVREVVKYSRIFYGGGIKSVDNALEMAKFADTVIVGNLIYEDFELALTTVKGINGTKEIKEFN